MHSSVVLAILIAVVLGIAALAIVGVRKARSMSQAHVTRLSESGQTDRLVNPKSREDHFLRPLSLKDVALGLIGAVVFTLAAKTLATWFGW